MKTKTQNLLPKILPGTVHAQYVRCGRKNCKCSRGELHGAYYFHFVRVGGKLTKHYLKASEVEPTQIACMRRQCEEKTLRTALQTDWKHIRELRESLRSYQNLYT